MYTEFIHVAPIAQEMLLGFDILHKKAVLNMRNKTLIANRTRFLSLLKMTADKSRSYQWYK